MDQISPQVAPSKIIELNAGPITFENEEFATFCEYFPIRSMEFCDGFDWAAHIEAVATDIFGAPNQNSCWWPSKGNICFGSISVNCEKGVWWDVKKERGGGTWDLIREYKGIENYDEAVAFAKKCRQCPKDDPEPETETPHPPKSGPDKWHSADRHPAARIKNFMSRVVPWPRNGEPGYVTLHWHLPGENFRGRAVRDVEEFYKLANALAQSKRSNLYFCLSRQAEAAKRNAKNALALYAIWLDLDVKKGAYATIEEAIEALFAFIEHYRLPPPSAVVSSGNGLHVYWFSNRELSVAEWRPYAEGLKAAALAWGLKCDAGLITNAACVLRIPGTKNFKSNPPKPVRLGLLRDEGIDFAADLKMLLELAPGTDGNGKLGPIADEFKHLDPNERLGEGVEEYPPLLFVPIKEGCAWLREVHETGGANEREPLWHQALRCCVYLADSEKLIHELSKAHSGYTPEKTEAKFERARRDSYEQDLGWPSCKAIQGEGCTHCKTCPHLAEGGSPLHLGLRQPADADADAPETEQQSSDTDAPKAGKADDPLERAIRERAPKDKQPEIVSFVINEMLRRGYRTEAIIKVLLDRNNGVSEHIYGQIEPHEYTVRQIEQAIEEIEFDRSKKGKKGKILLTAANIRIALIKLGVTVRYDRFADRALIDELPGYGPALEDAAVNRLWLQFMERLDFSPRLDLVHIVVDDTARLNGFHPVRDYLDALQWDGVPRIDKWLTTYAGAEDSKYTRTVGALYLIAGVRRVRHPGCKFDEMLVLEQPLQGTDKSSALAVLAVKDDWFCDDLPLNADGKRVIETLRGKWIVEAAELSGMRKADVEHLKALLSRRIDRARPAYGRLPIEAPRQCIFTGTTNKGEYLRDTTGNRRFWPILIVQFNLDALRRDRDQLWAEAAAREAKGESIRLPRELWPEAAKEQRQRLADDPFVAVLAEHLGHREGKIKAADVWKILNLQGGQLNQDVYARTAEAMKRNGWKRPNTAGIARFGGEPVAAYVRGNRRNVINVMRDNYGLHITERDSEAQADHETTEHALVQFLNHCIGNEQALYTNNLKKSDDEMVEFLHGPLQGRPVYVQVVCRERKILISKKAFGDYLHKQPEGYQAAEVAEGLTKFFNAKEIRQTLGAGTSLSKAQEAVFEIPVPHGMELLEGILKARGGGLLPP